MSYGKVAAALALISVGCGDHRLVAPPHPSPDLGGVADAAPQSGSDLAGPAAILDGALAGDAAPPITTDAIIRIHYPVGSHAMALRGDSASLNWTTGVPLTGANNVFQYTLPSLSAPVQYKPLLDDATWSRGPNYVVKPGQSVDIYPHFIATHGTYKPLFASFPSKILTYNQRVWVYLPSSYDENTLATYPVVYMHDGQNLFDPNLAYMGHEWMVDETLDAASDGDSKSGGGLIREIIVIGPEAGPNRNPEYTPTYDASQGFGGDGDKYLRMLVEELKPQVDAMLRTQPGRATTGILGSSLGGLISAYAGCTHADTFGIVGAMSPSTWWDNNMIIGKVGMMMPAPMRPLRIYLDSGDTGPSNDDVTQTTQLYMTVLQDGYTDGVDAKHVVEHLGQHGEIWWAGRLPGALAFLFGPR